MSFRLTAVGEQFANADGGCRQDEIRCCRPREQVTLEAETANPKHSGAIAVYSVRGVQVGYLRRRDADWLKEKMGMGTGLRAKIIAIAPRSRPFDALRVTLDVQLASVDEGEHD